MVHGFMEIELNVVRSFLVEQSTLYNYEYIQFLEKMYNAFIVNILLTIKQSTIKSLFYVCLYEILNIGTSKRKNYVQSDRVIRYGLNLT